MSYSLVQCPAILVEGNATSHSKSFASTPTVGNLVVVCVASFLGAPDTGSVTDNQDNDYTRCAECFDFYTSNTHVAIYYTVVETASGTFTITFTPDSTAYSTMVIAEFSGNTATPIDQDNSDVNGGVQTTTPVSGEVTPTEDNELLVAAMMYYGDNQTITEDGDWSLLRENEGGTLDCALSAVYKIQTTATADEAGWTIQNSSYCGGCIATFKAASGEPPVTHKPTTQFMYYQRMRNNYVA